MAFDAASLFALVKPLIKKFVDEVAIPEVMKLEQSIGPEAVKSVVGALTLAVETEIDKLLS